MPKDSLGFRASFPVSVDAKGNFEIRDVPSGTYWLGGSYNVDEKFFSAQVPLEVGSSNIEGIELTLQPPLEVAGHVVIESNAELKVAPVYMLNFQQKNTFGGPAAQVNHDLTFKILLAGC